MIPPKTTPAIITVAIGLIAGLILAEIASRMFYSPANHAPMLSFHYSGSFANCYPTDPYNSFPFDIRREKDLDDFKRHFPRLAGSDKFIKMALAEYGEGMTTNYEFVRSKTPHCLVYDLTNTSPRRLFIDHAAQEKIALIGDSFAFGQGVETRDTYGAQLAQKLKANIFNYSNLGANFERIVEQFQRVLRDHTNNKYDRLLYLFVLNDPLMTENLLKKQDFINDFMNLREYRLKDQKKNFIFRSLLSLAQHSYLTDLLVHRYLRQDVTAKTIAWYKDIYDPNVNPAFLATMKGIVEMNAQAQKNNIAFTLVLYPLMIPVKSYPFSEIHQTMRELCTKQGIQVIDLLPAFLHYPDKRLTVHPVDSHPNAFAHQIAARATAAALSTNDLR